jgi:hypothetical protein
MKYGCRILCGIRKTGLDITDKSNLVPTIKAIDLNLKEII